MPVLKPGIEKKSHSLIEPVKLPDYSPLDYHEANNQYLEILEQQNIQKLIDILDKNLRKAIEIEINFSGGNINKNSFWRSAIEESDQNMGDSAKDSLLKALRDTISHLILSDRNGSLPIIERYLTDCFEIFRRLALYLLSLHPEKFQNLIKSELTNFQKFDDIGIHHEYFLLLASGFPYLESNQQENLVNTILQGPSSEKFDNLVQSVISEGGDPEKFRKTYLNHWIKNRLWMIRSYLSGTPKAKLEELVLETG